MNDIGIVVARESHLTSTTSEGNIDIESSAIKRCDHPNNIPCERLVFQVKLGNKKCFLPVYIEILILAD